MASSYYKNKVLHLFACEREDELISSSEYVEQMHSEIKKSGLVRSFAVVHTITREIAEFANGWFEPCSNYKCHKEIPVTHDELLMSYEGAGQHLDFKYANRTDFGRDYFYCSDCKDFVKKCGGCGFYCKLNSRECGVCKKHICDDDLETKNCEECDFVGCYDCVGEPDEFYVINGGYYWCFECSYRR